MFAVNLYLVQCRNQFDSAIVILFQEMGSDCLIHEYYSHFDFCKAKYLRFKVEVLPHPKKYIFSSRVQSGCAWARKNFVLDYILALRTSSKPTMTNYPVNFSNRSDSTWDRHINILNEATWRWSEHTCAYARWAHMHRFLSVCHLTKIQTRK